MIPLDVACAFFLSSTVLALVPGPDNLFVLTQTLAHGRRAGLLATLGFCTGCLVHTAAITIGFSALLGRHAPALNIIKIIGAGYLLFLAVQALRSKPESAISRDSGPTRFFMRGVIMNTTNPKVLLFFLAYFPAFTNDRYGAVGPQLLQLSGLFILCTLLVFGAVALLAGAIQHQLTTKVQQTVVRLSALVYLGIALTLLLY